MNEQAVSLAALNVSLLEAIKAGPAGSRRALAERAGIIETNIARKLGSLTEAGLIAVSKADAGEVELTEDGERALRAISVWRGEDAHLRANPASDGVAWIAYSLIDPWPLNPRTWFDPAGVEDMAQSIADHGVLQPLTVRAARNAERFEVLIGERRRRGAALAVERGWIDDAADFLIPCQVRNWGDNEALDVAGVENLQRQDLHWMDEAKFYLALASRGRSGAEIARLAGESVSKRKVQDYCKIARELSEPDQARCYLPDTDPKQLRYTAARDLVGEKAEKPGLQFSPRLAVALMEVIHAGLAGRAPTLGAVVVTRLHRAPGGGPLIGLQQDRGVLDFAFHDFGPDEHGVSAGRVPVAKTKLTEDLMGWLRRLAYDAEPDNALRKVRGELLGDMYAAELAREHRWQTPELNPPPSAPEAVDRSTSEPPPPAGEGDHEVVEGALPPHDLAPEPEPAADAEIPAYLRNLAGPGAPHDLAPEPEPPLPPLLATIVIEVASRVGTGHLPGGDIAPDQFDVPVLADAHRDPHLDALIRKHGLLHLSTWGRQRTFIGLTNAALDWLDEQGVNVIDGRPAIGPVALEAHQRRFMGSEPKAAKYFTAWLNPPAAPAPDAAPAGEDASAAGPDAANVLRGGGEADREAVSSGPADAPYPPPQGEGDREAVEGASPTARVVAQMEAQIRAFDAMRAALRQVEAYLGRLKTTKPNPAEIEQHRQLVRNALDAADAARAPAEGETEPEPADA